MPDAMTHYYFGLDLMKQLPIEYNVLNEENKNLFFLYANFYDLPLYYEFGGINFRNYSLLSSRLHEKNTLLLIENLIAYIRENDFDPNDILLLYGIISHYVLDMIIHPFVLSRAGVYLEKKDAKKKRYHGEMERAFDYIMVFKKEQMDINTYDFNQFSFEFSVNTLSLIDKLIQKSLFYPKSAKIFETSARGFKNFLIHKAKDKFGLKKVINTLRYLLSVRKNKYTYLNWSYYQQVHEGIDYLNLEKKDYLDPFSGDIRNDSFFELYAYALRLGFRMLGAVNSYLYFGKKKEFTLFFKNINLNTGDFDDLTNVKYSSVIFK